MGRLEENAIAFPDDGLLSRRHLVMESVDGVWLVRDLGSKNGTMVNGVRITQAVRLNSGDAIQAGSVSLIIRTKKRFRWWPTASCTSKTA